MVEPLRVMVISEYCNVLEDMIKANKNKNNDTFYMNPIDKRELTLNGYNFVYSELIEVNTVYLLPNCYIKDNYLKNIIT